MLLTMPTKPARATPARPPKIPSLFDLLSSGIDDKQWAVKPGPCRYAALQYLEAIACGVQTSREHAELFDVSKSTSNGVGRELMKLGLIDREKRRDSHGRLVWHYSITKAGRDAIKEFEDE